MSRKRLLQALKDDSGVAALIIAAAIAVIGFTALSIFLNKIIGSHDLNRAKSALSAQGKVVPIILAYYMADTGSGAPLKLPCPDTDVTPTGKAGGAAGAACASPGTNYIGAIPWKTLGLTESDAKDTYGRYYTYIVSGDASALCESVTKGAGFGGTQEFSGKALTTARLEALLTSQSAGDGRKVPFVIIGHGLNGAGALTTAGKFTSAPTLSNSSSYEVANEASSNGTSYVTLTPSSGTSTPIYTGPVSLDQSSTSTYFDDEVFAPGTADIQKVCAQESPAYTANASLADNFDNIATSNNNFGNNFNTSTGAGSNGVTVQAASITPATGSADTHNKVAYFTASVASTSTSYLVTNSFYFNFDPLMRAVYVKADWRPESASGTISIATRGSATDLTAGSDLFTSGNKAITFRYSASPAIYNGSASAVSGAVTGSTTALTITAGQLYTVEAYDDGSNVWMRIYQASDPSIYAMTQAHGITGDTTGDQQVFFINGTTGHAEIDNTVVGFPMLAAETSGTNTSYISVAGNDTGTGELTLEAWVRPRAFPGSGDSALIAKWNNNSGSPTAASVAYRLRVDSAGIVHLDASTYGGTSYAVQNYTGPGLKLFTWNHIAVTYKFTAAYDQTVNSVAVHHYPSETVVFYKDGDVFSSATASYTSDSASGINHVSASLPNFYVGADLSVGSTVGDAYNGDIADVRVWSVARSSSDIQSNFESRLSAKDTDASIASKLVVNWRLDGESLSATNGLTFSSAAATGLGTAGTVSSARLVPTLALYFRPLSSGICPAAAISGAYQCDFRIDSSAEATGVQSTVTVPTSLTAMYAKMWGAGGGGFYASQGSSPGGSGGFSKGTITAISTTVPAAVVPIYKLAAATMYVYTGGGGVGTSSGSNSKLAGGGGSGVGIYDNAGNAAMIAGGGGGAAYSDDKHSGTFDCSKGTVKGTTTQCGLGGNGAGATINVMVNAPDDGAHCGGRAGVNASSGTGPSSSNSDCPNGGADHSGGIGGSAGTLGGAGGTDGGLISILSGGSGADSNETSGNNGTDGGGGGGGGAVGGEAGGYNHATQKAGYGGGGGSGSYDSSGVSNANGAAGSYSLNSSFSVASTNPCTVVSVNKAPSLVTCTEDVYTTDGWRANMSVSGGGIQNGATIVAILTHSSTLSTLTVSAGSGNGTHSNTVTASQSAGLASSPGGSTDFHRYPYYVTDTYNTPGAGGGSSTSQNGRPGAVVLFW